MSLKKFISVSAAMLITAALLLLLTSPLWIGWMMEYEHNKTKDVLVDVSLQCIDGAVEEREVWSKLGIAIYCEKDGIKHGIWQAWDGGYMHISGKYMHGKKHGTWHYFNANGEQWGKRKYERGKEVSELIKLLAADAVLLRKNERKLYLIRNNKFYRTYNVRLGSNPIGQKQNKDDGRTPEGHYILSTRDGGSKFYKSIHIISPSDKDQIQAPQSATNRDGIIMLHGLPNGLGWAHWIFSLWDWTDGSIAVNNQDMDEIWNLIEYRTSIEITP